MRIGGSLLALLTLGIGACSQPEAALDREPRPVRVEVLKGGEQQAKSGASVGLIRAGERATLSFQVPGRIRSLNVEVGDAVAKGQVIAALDSAPFELRAAQADAEVGRVRAVLQEVEQRLARQQQGARDGWAAPVTVETVDAEAKAARAAMKAAEAGAELAHRDAALSRLRAPFSGRIAKRSVEAFAEVQPGATIVEIDGDGLEAVAPVPSAWIKNVAPGSSVVVQIADQNVAGKVKDIASRSGAAGVVDAIIALPPDAEVRPGDAVRVVLPDQPKRLGALLIPYGAVLLSDQPGHGRVFVVEDGRAAPRPITFARIADDRAEVTSGLRNGETIITAGARFVNPGERVTATPDRIR